MPHPLLILFLISYVIVHSLLASLSCKSLAQRIWGQAGQRWYRLGYNIVATIMLLPLPLLLLLPDKPLYSVPAPWRWLMLAGQMLATLAALVILRQTSLGHFMGTAQTRPFSEGGEDPLITSGSYAYVRHPLYAAALPMMWLSPSMSVNWLTVYGIFSLYMYIGSFHEEYRLARQFGPAYRAYQQRVGRFLPRRIRRSGR